MTAESLPNVRVQRPALFTLCIAGSVMTHVLVLTLLPQWKARRDPPPLPLTVALLEQAPPAVEPPKSLPMETRPERVAREPVKPEAKPKAPRSVQEPILTAPPSTPDIPPSPAATVVPEQRQAPPPEAPRAPPPPVAAPAPVTQPRSDAAYLNNPRPAYPLAARRRGDQGTVLIRVLVTADGLAGSVGLEKTSGHPALDEAALTAVKAWRFVPARQGAQAVESPYVVPVVFKLD